MAVPSRIYDLSATAGSNSPAGTDSIGTTADDFIRAGFAIVRGDLATLGSDIASATTTDLGAVQGSSHKITGTTTITAFGTVAAGIWKRLVFASALTLTHNATSLILPGAANITTAANDTCLAESLGSGNWRVHSYERASGSGVNAPPPGSIVDYGGSSAPQGWLECDGSAVSRTTYANLFTAISTTWGTGDGSTTFNLPDFRGRARIGKGTGTVAETVAAGSVSTGSDTFTVTSNNTKWITGQAVVLTTSSGLPTGLSLATTYYLIRASATTIKFATSLANSQNGTAIDLTTQGTGNHTVTGTLTARSLAEIGGEESHAMSSTELMAHVHSIERWNNAAGDTGHIAQSSGAQLANMDSNSTGGNAAMNAMQPFGVTMVMIKT